MLTYAAVPYHSHRTPVTASCGSRVYSEQTDIARLPPGSPLWKEGVPHVKPTIKARELLCSCPVKLLWPGTHLAMCSGASWHNQSELGACISVANTALCSKATGTCHKESELRSRITS
eukprot:s4351_g2.t1